jgi:hypothetical protein
MGGYLFRSPDSLPTFGPTWTRHETYSRPSAYRWGFCLSGSKQLIADWMSSAWLTGICHALFLYPTRNEHRTLSHTRRSRLTLHAI